MNWKDKRVLVTGAAGFIGSHLVERLAALGARTRCLVRYNARKEYGYLRWVPFYLRKGLEILPGDLLSIDSVNMAVKEVDVVFHLASIMDISPLYLTSRQVIRNNVVGFLNLVEALKGTSVEKLINISSWEVYGESSVYPTPEDEPLKAISSYAASKICSEKIGEAYFRDAGLPVVSVRLFSTYGPRQRLEAIIPTIISQVMGQEEVYLGRMDTVRDFIFVTDVVTGLLKIAERTERGGQVVNLGTGKGTRIEDLACMAASIMGKEIRIIFDPTRLRVSEREISRSETDISRLEALTDWRPQIDLETGLKLTVDWFSSSLACVEKV